MEDPVFLQSLLYQGFTVLDDQNIFIDIIELGIVQVFLNNLNKVFIPLESGIFAQHF